MDMELYTKRFAEYFKTARRDSGIKLDDLAVQTDLAVSTLSKIAAGGFAPACDKIVLVAHHLGINSWDWFARLDPAFEEGEEDPRNITLPLNFDLADQKAVKEFIAGRLALKGSGKSIPLPETFDEADFRALREFVAGREALRERARAADQPPSATSPTVTATTRARGVFSETNLQDFDPATRAAILKVQEQELEKINGNGIEEPTPAPEEDRPVTGR